MTGDFEEVVELVEKIVRHLLAASGIDHPPVNPKKIAKKLGIVYGETKLSGRRGQSFRRDGRQHVEVEGKDRRERKNFALAHEIMELELKKVVEDHRECHRWANLGASFLLMPTGWFGEECRATGFDIARLKKVFSTSSWEAVALRTLNFSESIVTILDDGHVTRRKSSYPYHVARNLSDEEKEVSGKVLRTGKVVKGHFPSCEVTGYPVFEEERKRVILRTTFEE